MSSGQEVTRYSVIQMSLMCMSHCSLDIVGYFSGSSNQLSCGCVSEQEVQKPKSG